VINQKKAIDKFRKAGYKHNKAILKGLLSLTLINIDDNEECEFLHNLAKSKNYWLENSK
jgi:hypothetical protein